MNPLKRKNSKAEEVQKRPKVQQEHIREGGLLMIEEHYEDSGDQSRDLFAWMISPKTVSEYDKQYWETEILHIQRHQKQVPTFFISFQLTSSLIIFPGGFIKQISNGYCWKKILCMERILMLQIISKENESL